MGAWGVHFDQNDGTLDFLGDVEENREWSDVRHFVRDYVDNGGYDDAAEAVGALELVAAALGRPSPRLKPALRDWAAGHAAEAAGDRAPALAAVELVYDASELSELWAEADEGEDWAATIADLRERLGA